MQVQHLESRRLFSIVVQTSPGFYEIWGTSAADTMNVTVDQAAKTFNFNGSNYGGLLHLNILAGAGNDSVTVGQTGVGSIAVSVHGGFGQDYVRLNMDGAVWGD